MEIFVFHYTDWKQVTADWLFIIGFSIIIGLFNSTFHHSVLVIITIHTDTAVDSRGYDVKLIVKCIGTIFLDQLNGFRGQVGFQDRIEVFY
ncbi:hypothetical protein D9M68_741220 [compost metagenome]